MLTLILERMRESSKLLAKNTMLLYVRMFVLMAVTLYTSRVILRVLGVEDFGIYDVVGGVVAIFTSISSSISNASNRFITFYLGKGGLHEVRVIFNIILIMHVITALLIFILCETVGFWFFYNQLNIPIERLDASIWVFQSALLSIVLVFLSFPYNSVIIAHEKMNVYAILSIIDVFLRLAIVFVLEYFPIDKLKLYSVLVVSVQFVMQAIYITYCYCKFEETKPLLVWDRKLAKQIIQYMSYIFYGTIAFLGYSQGINILLNIFFGPVVNAARGIAIQVQTAVFKFSDNFQTAIKPQIIISFAQEDMTHTKSLIETGTKIVTYLLLVIIFPILFNIDCILKWWLGNVPEYTAPFTVILVIVCVIKTISGPLMIAIQAKGKIKKVQLIETFILLSLLPISYYLLKYLSFSPVAVFSVYLIAELLSFLTRAYIALSQLFISRIWYLQRILYPIFLVSIFSLIFPFGFAQIDFGSELSRFVFMLVIIELPAIISIWTLGLSHKEKSLVKGYVMQLLHK